MKIIRTSRPLRVAAEKGRAVLELAAGRRYVMHDVEAESGRQAGALDSIASLPEVPPRWDPGSPASSIVLPFIGGLGDAVSMLPVLAAIRASSGATVAIATTPGPAGVFGRSPVVDEVLSYPLTLERWRGFDAYLTMEAVYETGAEPGAPLNETFARAMGVALAGRDPAMAPLVREPRGADDPPVVAIHVGDGASLRACPRGTIAEVIARLVETGHRCLLLGLDDPAWHLPACPPVVVDLRSRTPTVETLVAALAYAEVVVAHDSFIMHLAGSLGIPTVALFAPSSPRHAEPYATALPVVTGASCAPCHAAGDACPLGHVRCVAWDDVRAETIVEHVASAVPGPACATP